MTDAEKLEVVTEAYFKSLIANRFEDISYYKELAKRVAALTDAEIQWIQDQEMQRKQMQVEILAWQTDLPGSLN